MDELQTLLNDSDWSASGQTRSFSEVAENIFADQGIRDDRKRNPRYLRKLLETAQILDLWQKGRISEYRLREILSTADFPILFGDILDRRLLDQYQTTTNVWSSFCARGTVPDFRQSRIIAVDGLQEPFFPATYVKPEGANTKYLNSLTETGYVTQVQVYERAVSWSWRMMINRSLNFLSRVPTLLANGARRTEEKFATQLIIDPAGNSFNATFFSNANQNIVSIANGASTNNPPLSVQGIKDALNVMYRQRDTGNDPIEIAGVTLLVPPLLKITAQEILRAITYEYTPATAALGIRVLTPNWTGDISPAVDWYLPVLDTSATHDLTWYLFADPSKGRPALEVDFLAGYEQPSLWQKAPNTMRLGGSVDPMMGQFEDSSHHLKGMHIIGGTQVDPKMAVVSRGDGNP